MSNEIIAGVNNMNLDLSGKTVNEIKEELTGLLNLDGSEAAKVNGVEVTNSHVLQSNDKLEFVKASGEKGAVELVSGVNNMSLDVAGNTVSDIVSDVASLLTLSGDETVKVNGAEVSASFVVSDGDKIEFVKATGEKGAVTVTVVSGVDEIEILADGDIMNVVAQVRGPLNLDGEESIKVNGSPVNSDYVPQDGDKVELSKKAGEKGAVSVTVVSGVNEIVVQADGDIMDVVTTVRGPLNLEGNESIKVNGAAVNSDYVPQDGDKVELSKKAGEKGC